MISLCKQMKTDGLIPFAFGQKDGWPALGTFDILDLRLNGFDFHMNLMRHHVPWTDKRVTAVFKQWAELIPYVQAGATGRTWQDATKALEQKKAGMLFQGTNQVAAQYVSDKANLSDLDFFVYPEINPKWGQLFMDAPMDGFCIAEKTQNYAAAAKLLEYIGTGSAEKAYLKFDKWDVAVAQGRQRPGVQRDPEEVGSGHCEVSAHRPVHGPRQRSRLRRQHRCGRDRQLRQQPLLLEHRLDSEEPRGAGEVHLRLEGSGGFRWQALILASPRCRGRRVGPVRPSGGGGHGCGHSPGATSVSSRCCWASRSLPTWCSSGFRPSAPSFFHSPTGPESARSPRSVSTVSRTTATHSASTRSFGRRWNTTSSGSGSSLCSPLRWECSSRC